MSKNIYKNMPPIAFGTGLLKGDDCKKHVIQAIEAGIRIIDTAQSYLNEEDTGNGILYCIENGIVKREELFIITKLNAHKPVSYNIAIQSYEESLKKLKLDYVDLYLIHAPNMTEEDKWKHINRELWKAFEYLYLENKVKYIGVSNFMIHHLEELLRHSKIKPFVNQIECHPVWQQKELVEYCKDSNIHVQGYYAILNGRYRKHPILEKLSAKYNKSSAQILLRWAFQKGITPVFQSKNKNHLLENLDIFDFKINHKDIKELETLNSHPFNASPESWYERYMWRERANKQLVKVTYKLFNKINLMKMKQTKPSTFKYYLFDLIPILKVVKREDGSNNIYVFGIKLMKSYPEYELEKILPRYESK